MIAWWWLILFFLAGGIAGFTLCSYLILKN